jgi:molybdenum cofactor cytidylyltransferase
VNRPPFPEAFCAIIPAAGRSARFGSDKRQALIDGVPMLERVVSLMSHAGAEPVIVVRDNPDPDRGMFSSIQIGLADAVASAVPVILVQPADMPYVTSETVGKVAAECARTGTAVCPRFEGQRGHPLALPLNVAKALLDLEPRTPLNEAFAQIGLVRTELDVDDPGVLRDVDRPQDIYSHSLIRQFANSPIRQFAN